MRIRSLTGFALVAALTLAAPGTALANHGRHHHHKRVHLHARGQAHHANVRFVHLGPTPSTATGPSAPTSTPPSTTPENAGMVASYLNGVLTLTLNDSSSVSGKVTNNTKIRCVKAAPTPTAGEDQPGDHSQGDDHGQGDDQSRGDMNQQGNGHWGDSKESQGDDGDDDGTGQGATEPPCDSSALLPGTVVRAAELSISSTGTEFESIELVR